MTKYIEYMTIPMTASGSVLTALYNQDQRLDPNKRYMIALTGGYMPVSWRNIYAGVNDTIKISKDAGATWTTITLPPGLYTVSDVGDFLFQKQQDTEGFLLAGEVTADEKDDTVAINITWDRNMLKARVEIRTNFAINFDKMANFFGFTEATKIVGAGTTYSDNTPNEEGTYKYYKIHCNLCAPQLQPDSEGVQGQLERILYSNNPSTGPGSTQALPQIDRIQWLPLDNINVIRDVKAWLSNQDGEPIDLNGQKMFLKIEIEARST